MRIFVGVLAILLAIVGVFVFSIPKLAPESTATPPPISAELLSQLPQDRKGQVLIYGAYGFSGAGIAQLASQYGITPVLSGRNEAKLKPLADELGYDYIVLSLENNHANLVAVLEHFEVVLHIAGPYTYTAKPMLDAAVAAGTHYLDLTGENHVIQAALDRDEEFKRANIMVMPAVGYDVVPTDCLNLYVANQIDNPSNLTVILNGNYNDVEGAGMSRGTAKSGLEIISRPLLMRIDGAMIPVQAPKVINRSVDGQAQTLIQIPWADMVTSYVTTGVPTIEVFQVQEGEFPSWIPRLAQSDFGRRLLAWMIDTFFPEGPPASAQQERQTRIEATASNNAGESASAALITPEGYQLTFHSTLLVAKRVIDGYWEPGFQTPARVYGADLVLEVPGVTRIDLDTL